MSREVPRTRTWSVRPDTAARSRSRFEGEDGKRSVCVSDSVTLIWDEHRENEGDAQQQSNTRVYGAPNPLINCTVLVTTSSFNYRESSRWGQGFPWSFQRVSYSAAMLAFKQPCKKRGQAKCKVLSLNLRIHHIHHIHLTMKMGQNPVNTDLGTKQAAAALACAHMRSHLFPHVTPRVHPKDLFSGNPRLSKTENVGQIQCLQYAFE